MTDHPLRAWLKRHKLKPYRFADQIGMPRRTLYSHLAGATRNPSVGAMTAIAAGTDGRVTVKAQMTWFVDRALAPQIEAIEEAIFDEPENPDEIGDETDEGPLGFEP